MPLTSHLKDTKSPIRQFILGSAPRLAVAGTRGREGKDAAASFGFDSLTETSVTLPFPATLNKKIHASTTGMAFDYRARMALTDLRVSDTTAQTGLRILKRQRRHIPNGRHVYRVLNSSVKIAEKRARNGDDADMSRFAVVLAWSESMYRAGPAMALNGSLGTKLRESRNREDLLRAISPLMIQDLTSLVEGSRAQLEGWRAAVHRGANLVANPTFIGAPLVDGADGDLVIGETLVDCKTTEAVSNPWIRETLFQLIGYAILDLNDAHRIRNVAIWLPRRQAYQSWSLDELFGSPAETALPALRRDFYSRFAF